jgi:DNA polymerase-3 subunit delta'
VDAAREVVGFAQTTRARGNTKVVLVYPADRLNVESANTLLKTLEEPAGELRFVLATEAAHLLPATIRSRCQTHALAWPEPDEALAWLQTHTDVPATLANAATWLKAAGGRPDDALAWGRLGLTPALWSALPQQVAAGDGRTLSGWAPAQQLDVLQKIAHDLLATQSGGTPRYFDATDLPKPAQPMALQAWVADLLQAARTVEHPVGAGLMLEAWLARAQQALRPTSGRRALANTLHP